MTRPPRKRPRVLRRAVLEGLVQARDPQEVIRALASESAPSPFPRQELPSRFSISAVDLEKAGDKLGDKGELVRVKKYGIHVTHGTY